MLRRQTSLAVLQPGLAFPAVIVLRHVSILLLFTASSGGVGLPRPFTYHRRMRIDFVCVYASIDSAPISRPIPDCL